MNSSLANLGEFGLLRSLKSFWASEETRAGSHLPLLSVGDDCAVIACGEGERAFLLLTTDTMIEGRHFLRAYSTATQIGHKLLAVNLSDIAAMGGSPHSLLITLQLPPDIHPQWVQDFYRGLTALANEFQVGIIGGDTVESPTLGLGVTAIGFSSLPPRTRRGAEVGDDLWVSGTIGGAGAGLKYLQGTFPASENVSSWLTQYQAPTPRVELGKILLAQNLANSLIDISDGLLQDAGHIAEQSQKTLLIDLDQLPLAPGLPMSRFSSLDAASAGDDYELLFSAPSERRKALELLSGKDLFPKLSRIGSVQTKEQHCPIRISEVDQTGRRTYRPLSEVAAKSGFQHFQSEKAVDHDEER